MRIENDLGYIELSRKAIADIAADTAMQCYGLVGMAHQRGLSLIHISEPTRH